MKNNELTNREYEVLKLLTEGKGNDEIAEILSVEICTVKAHISSILRKLDVKNRLQAATKVLREKDKAAKYYKTSDTKVS